MRLADAIATPDGKRRYVRKLFSTIADRYDLITVVLSYGQDQRWKRRLVDLAAPPACIRRSGGRALDLATGTGDIAFRLAATRLERGRPRRHAAHDRAGARQGGGAADAIGRVPGFLVGDMLALPFPDRVVRRRDGRLRAAQRSRLARGHRRDPSRAEATAGRSCRSTSTGRRTRSCAASTSRICRSTGGLLGWVLHGDPDTYRYIPASIRNYPGAEGVARLLEARGFVRVGTRRSSAAS